MAMRIILPPQGEILIRLASGDVDKFAADRHTAVHARVRHGLGNAAGEGQGPRPGGCRQSQPLLEKLLPLFPEDLFACVDGRIHVVFFLSV